MDHRSPSCRADSADPRLEVAGAAASRGRSAAVRRARRSFWSLVVIAALATGSLSIALNNQAGPSTGVQVALSGTVVLVSLALAARVMIALERARRRARVTAAENR